MPSDKEEEIHFHITMQLFFSDSLKYLCLILCFHCL